MARNTVDLPEPDSPTMPKLCPASTRKEVSAGNLAAAQHPYTQGLLNCLPRLGDNRHPLPTLDRQPEWAL